MLLRMYVCQLIFCFISNKLPYVYIFSKHFHSEKSVVRNFPRKKICACTRENVLTLKLSRIDQHLYYLVSPFNTYSLSQFHHTWKEKKTFQTHEVWHTLTLYKKTVHTLELKITLSRIHSHLCNLLSFDKHI